MDLVRLAILAVVAILTTGIVFLASFLMKKLIRRLPRSRQEASKERGVRRMTT